MFHGGFFLGLLINTEDGDVPPKLLSNFNGLQGVIADHSGSTVLDMNCLRSLESWDRGFESHSWHGCQCVRLSCVSVVLRVGRGLATG
jgi:hypothetical protein